MHRHARFLVGTLAAAALLVPSLTFGQPYEINAKRLMKAGEEFRMEGRVENHRIRKVTVSSGDQQPDLDMTTSLEYAMYVQVKKVEDGAPTSVRCTITRLILNDGESKRSMIGAPPDVTAIRDENGNTKIEKVSGTASNEVLAALYDVIKLEPRTVQAEDLVTSTQPRNVGDSWAVDPKMAAQLLGEEHLDVQPSQVTAKAKLISVEKDNGDAKLTVGLDVSASHVNLAGVLPDFMHLTQTSCEAHWKIVVPMDPSKPILGRTVARSVKYKGTGTQSGVTVNADHFATMTEEWTRTPVGK